MKRQQKHTIVQQLTGELKNAQSFYIIDASGLTVTQTNLFRKLCFEKNIVYKVVKNTLIRRALVNLQLDEKYADFSQQVLKNFSGLMLMSCIDATPAKIIQQFRKESNTQQPLLKGASVDHALFFGEESLQVLSRLKSKEELMGDIITLLQTPVKHLIGALQSGQNALTGILETLSKK